MRNVVKWAAGLVALALLAAVIAGLALWRTVAPSSGRAEIAALSAPVEIVRDEHAIAHIEAATLEDAARALGFVHAQERLWQMETLRRTARGRLAALFGKDAVGFDVFLRTLAMDRAAETSVAALKPETVRILEAYADGVNAWAGRDRGMLEPSLPPEFLVFGSDFEPWKPADTVAVLKLMSLQLSQNLGAELRRLNLAARGMDAAEIADLMPAHADDRPPPLPGLREILPLRPARDVRSAEGEETALGFLAPPMSRWASNSWVVGGARTVSGKPLLANDPHLAFGAPSLWYLAHMRWGEGEARRNLIGASLPGMPLVLLGRTDDLAWGFTNAGADAQDIFIERVKAGEENLYLTPDGWRPFETRRETIEVAGGEAVTFERRETRHGPVLPDELPIPSDAPTTFSHLLRDLHVTALRWTGLAKDDTTLDALLTFTTARTTGEMIEGLGGIVSPMQAIVVADTAGDIALVTPARVPVRNAANRVAGRAPVPGWLALYDWKDVMPADAIAPVRPGPEASLVTANTRLPNAGSLHMTYDWDEPDRLARAVALVNGPKGPHDLASMVAAQNDTRSEPLLRLRDRLLAIHRPEAPHDETLRAWTGDMDRGARAPLLMVAWAKNLTKQALADDLGSAFEAFDDIDHQALDNILSGGVRDWCDDRATGRVESCAEIVEAAWTDALAELRARYGDDPATWSWGRAHPVRNAHQPFDRVPILRRLFTIERPASGGPHTLNRGKTNLGSDEPYASVHGAGYKAVYDLAQPERSLFIQTTGQSGNPFSRRYRDLATRWADGGMLPMVTDPAVYRARASGIWRLRPSSAE